MAKRTDPNKSLKAIGFNTQGQIRQAGDNTVKASPLPPIDDSKGSIGFDKPLQTTPAPIEGPTPSEQYTEGYIIDSSLKDTIAANQDGWDQFANFVGQTGVEALAGTVETASYLLDFQQHLDKLRSDEQEYRNWLSETMNDFKEQVRTEGLPVYLSGENEGFEPGNAEWWAHHGGAGVGTVLGLMIPGLGVAKLGKAAGLGKVGQAVSATIASRYAESTMEANQVFESSYSKLIDQGLSEEQAKLQAGDAASKVWNTNWLFAIQDLTQFSSITKGFNSVAKGKKGLGISEFLKQSISEGAEEAGQYTVAKEGERVALDTSVDYFGQGFEKRLEDYINDDEFATSTLLGAVGGGVFHAAGQAIDKLTDVEQGNYIQRAKEKVSAIINRGLQKERANYVGDTGTSQKISDIEFIDQLIDKFNKGKLNEYKTELEELKKTPDLTPEVRSNITNYIEDVDFVTSEEAKLKSSTIPSELYKPVLLAKLEQKQLARLQKQLTTDTNNIEQNLIRDTELDPKLLQLKKLQVSSLAYEKLAQTNPGFAKKAKQAAEDFTTQKELTHLAFPLLDLDKSLITSQDDALVEKAFQLVSTQEKQATLKDDLQKLTTRQGVKQAVDKQVERLEVEKAKALSNSNDVTIPQLRQEIANNKSIAANVILTNKLAALVAAKQVKNQGTSKAVVDNFPPVTVPTPTPTTPVEPPIPGMDMFPPDIPPNMDFPPDIDPSQPFPSEMPTELEFAGGIAPDEAKWAGLSKEQVNDMLERIDMEERVPKHPPATEQKDKDQQATEETIQRTTVPAWLKEVNDNGSKTEYTNNITGEKATADKIFAIDERTGQLLANTPIVQVGSMVLLVVENDFPWTLTPGFKPNKPDNEVINVYLVDNDGNRIGTKPIKQLPSADNPRLVGQKVIRELRSKVLARGSLTTMIVGKNVGTIRTSPTLNSLDVLGSDYILDPSSNTWQMQRTPWKPVLGFIDFNGNPIIPNLGSMNAITDDVVAKVKDTLLHPRSNDLSKLRGKVITFRTAPDGSMRLVGLEPRTLSDQEIGWLMNNMDRLILDKDYSTLSNVLYIPRHPSGVYSTKGGKKPDVLNLERRRIHIVDTTRNTSDILIPITGKEKQPLWVVLDSKQLTSFLNGKSFSFRIIGPSGAKSELYTNYPKQQEIVDTFRKILSNQFKNINKDQLNSEIRYTDIVEGKSYTSYYDYLIQTNSVQTSLPGSKTIGYGDDSSYSMNQVALYLDPNPPTVDFVIGRDPEKENIIITQKGPVITPPSEQTKTNPEINPLDIFFGPEAQLKPAVLDSGHKFKLVTEKELQWFKDNIGEEFLIVAKNVDTFIARNGVEAFGQYYNSLVTLADYAPEGTLYHEAGHFLLDTNNGLVTIKEKEKILDEGSKVYNIKRSKTQEDVKLKPVDYKLRATEILQSPKAEERQLSGDEQIEERIMEDFERYKISDGRYKPRVATAKGFFSKLLQMIKKIIGFKSPIEKLFIKLDNVTLNQEQRDRIRDKAKGMVDPPEAQYKKLPGFRWVSQQQQSIQTFTSEVMRLANEYSRQTSQDLVDLFTDKKRLDTFIDEVRAQFLGDFRRIHSVNPANRSQIDQSRYWSYLAMGINDKAIGLTITDQDLPYIGQWEDSRYGEFPEEGFKTKMLKDLSRYGFVVRLSDGTLYENTDEEETQTTDNLELKQEDEAERLYDIDHTLTNPSKSISQRMRLFLANIPEPVIGEDNTVTNETKKTIFGTTKYLDFRRVDGNLALKLRDSINPITRLYELSENDPIAQVVYDTLISEKNKGNTELFNEFAAKYNRDGYYKKTVLYGTRRVQLRSEEIDPAKPHIKSKIEFFARTIDSDRASSDRTLHGKWREEAIRKKVIDTDGEVNQSKADYLYKQLTTFKEKLTLSKQKKNRLPYEEIKESFDSILRELGVTIPTQVWKEFDSIPNPGLKFKKIEDMYLGEKGRKLEELLIGMKKGIDPFESSTLLTNLAKISSVYVEDSRGGAFRNDSGNQEYPINYPCALTELFNQIKQTPKDVYEFYLQDNFFAKNKFLLAIKNNNSAIDLTFTSSIRRNEDDPKDFGQRTAIDSLIMRFTTYYNNAGDEGWFFTGTAADKTKQPIVSLPKHKGAAAKDFLFTVLRDTIDNEVVRIQRLNQYPDQISTEVPLPGSIASLKKNNRFVYIPALNSIPNLVNELSAGDMSTEEYNQAIKDAENVINQFITSEFEAFKSYLVVNDIVTISRDKDNNEVITNKRIPAGLLGKAKPVAFLEEFFYNDLAWRLELSKVLMGDLALYKSQDDYFKRAYQLVTPGVKGYSEEERTLTRGVYAKQEKINTPEYLAELTKLVGKEVAEKYKNVNKTDAQSLITIDAYRTLATALGQWSKDAERIYEVAWSKGLTIRQATEDPELRRIGGEILLQPFKPFQFNNRKIVLPDGKVMILKEQFKDSITPITPELTTVHEGYKDLLSYMKVNKVDIMSAEDTLKVGSYGVVSDFSLPLQEWQRRVVQLSDFRFPQLMPEKKKEEVLGTQFHKLILGNLKDPKLREEYNKLWVEKIKSSSTELRDRLGVGEDWQLSEDPKKAKDQLFKLKTVLEQELLSRDLNENYNDLLEIVRLDLNQVDFSLPLSFPAFGQKFQSIMTNLWKKAVLRQKSPGYSAINLADFGIGYSSELKFIQNKDGNVQEAEIGLPIDHVKEIGLKYGTHILPNGRILWDKLSENQRNALQFIVYRIPTSNKSSMLPVRVAVITPPQLNNIVIIPGELTIQQGLDFDVDKSQLLRRVVDSSGKVNTSNVDTKLFDIYWSILTDPAYVKELLTPLASPTLVTKFKEYLEKGLIDLGTGSSIASTHSDVKAEIRNKDGKAEIGIASRYNTGHAILQGIKDYISVTSEINILIDGPNEGVVNNYRFNELGRDLDAHGTFISENHAESQQAALDAAKEPLLSHVNVVTGTMAAFHTMIDFGVPLPVITDFFMQPVVREWTKFYMQENQKENKATERLFTAFPSIKAQFIELIEGNTGYNLTDRLLNLQLSQSLGVDALHDARVLQEFLKIIEIARQLTNINNVLSVDTFQDVTGIESLQSVLQQKDEVTRRDNPVSIDRRVFGEDSPIEGKRLAAFFKYGIEDALAFSGQFFPSVGESYNQVREYYVSSTQQHLDKYVIKQLNQFIDYYNLEGDSLLSRTLTVVHPLYSTDSKLNKADYRNRWSYFSQDKSLWKYIGGVLEKYPILKNNELIRNLESVRTQKGKNQVQMVGIRNTDNNTAKNEITNAWYELLNANNQEIRVLAHDLIRFAIQTSAFNYSTRSMFDLIPIQFWIESGLGAAWRSIVTFSDSAIIDQEGVVTNFIRHNFKNIEKFPEFYGRFSKDGFSSDSISSVQLEQGTQHIVGFSVADTFGALRILPRFVRVNDHQIDDYRLYEASVEDPLQYKEVQPLGEKNAYYEVTVDGRNESNHPGNKRTNAKPDPWFIKPKATQYPLFDDGVSGTNPYIGQYLDEKSSPETVLHRLLASEVDVEAKASIEYLLNNVNKIATSIEVSDLDRQFGVFEVKDTGVGVMSTIKINPNANVESDYQMRHILLHELHHAYSVGVLQNPEGEQQVSFVRNIERLRQDVISRLGVVKGTENKFEFIAELASNKEFRNKIKKKDLWSRLIRLFRKLLDRKDSFDQVLNEYYNILDQAQDLQKLTPSEFALKQEEKPTGSKRIDLLAQMLSSLSARESRLRHKGEKKQAKKLRLDIDTLRQLSKNKRNQAVVKYLMLVDKEVKELKSIYNKLSAGPSRINPDVLYTMREQLISYKLLDSFSDQIRLNPSSFVATGGDPAILLKSLDDLRADVHRLSNDTRRLAIRRFAHVIHKSLQDPSLTLESIVDQLEVADRDIDWLNRWTGVGVEMDDVAIRTAHKLLTDNSVKAHRSIMDSLYNDEKRKQTTRVAIKKPMTTGEGYYWSTLGVDFTSVGMFKALNEYETWVGKNKSFADKFAPIIDSSTLSENDDGVHLISPFSKEGRRILSIPKESKDYPLRQFYETFVLGYLKSQESIPSYSLRPGLRIPSIQRSALEGVLREEGLSKLQVIRESVIDSVRMRYDETDFKAVDENGDPQQYLPVRFIAKQDGKNGRLSTREVSLDLATTLPIFMYEMQSRKGLEAIQADLELGKMVLADREVMKTRRIKGHGLSPFLTRQREGIPLSSGKFETIKGEQSKSYEVFDSLLRRYLYGQFKKNEGDFLVGSSKFNVSKIVDSLLRFTGFKLLFGSIAVPLTNAAVGELTMIKEVVGSNIVNKSDYAAGKRLYTKIALGSIADLGRREKKTKYGRVFTYFNPLDTARPVTDLGVDTNYMRTIWHQVVRSGANAVDFYLGSTAIGAVMNRFKAKDSSGKEVSLYEAIEVSETGKVQLNPGYTYKGKKSISSEDINEVRDYTLRLFQLMNGVYNKMDKPAMNEFVVGRLIGFMRNWLVPGINARWRTKFYDEKLHQQNEGHYVSALVAFNNVYGKGGWIKGTIDSLRILMWFGVSDPELLLLPNELELSTQEKEDIINLRKANIRKTLFELYLVVAITSLMALGWDDTNDDSYVYYMLARIRRELTTFYSPSTAWDVLRTPTVALDTVAGTNKIVGDLVDSIGAVITDEEQPIYERGPYKGDNKLWADTRKQLGLGFEKQFEDLDVKSRLIIRGYR